MYKICGCSSDAQPPVSLPYYQKKTLRYRTVLPNPRLHYTSASFDVQCRRFKVFFLSTLSAPCSHSVVQGVREVTYSRWCRGSSAVYCLVGWWIQNWIEMGGSAQRQNTMDPKKTEPGETTGKKGTGGGRHQTITQTLNPLACRSSCAAVRNENKILTGCTELTGPELKYSVAAPHKAQ